MERELAAIIASSDSPEEVEAKLAEWTQSTDAFQRLGDVLFVTTARADMAGQLMVAGREADVVALAAADVAPREKSFLDLPWVEAIEYFKRRGLVRATDFETLLAGYAQRAAVARQLMLEQVQAETMNYLLEAIEKGGTYPEFAAQIGTMTENLGLTPANPTYLQMVFRTNVQSAYGAGRYRAITNPEVMSDRPFVQYRTVRDARVREEHKVLDGKVYASADPLWHNIAPPNGYNCRCSMVTMTRVEAEAAGISTEIPEGYIPTPGFDQPPTALLDAETEQPPQPVVRPPRGR